MPKVVVDSGESRRVAGDAEFGGRSLYSKVIVPLRHVLVLPRSWLRTIRGEQDCPFS